MQKIIIKNFGPITNAEIDIKNFLVLIGDNAIGKSTVIKLISTFLWMEKALVRGDYTVEYFTKNNRFRNEICKYYKIENYFVPHNLLQAGTEIIFKGTMFCFKYNCGLLLDDDKLLIKKIDKTVSYRLPQITYIPAERNLVEIVKNPKTLKLISNFLIDFISEYDKAKNELKGYLQIPIGDDISIRYQRENDTVYIKGSNYEIPLNEAASGIQSNVPLYLVTWYLSKSVIEQSKISQNMSIDEIDRFKKGVEDILANENFTEEQRRAALSVLSLQFKKTAFINIIEEPEQNLFPVSQMQMLKSLISICNKNEDNKLILSTHSPYILTILNNSLFAQRVIDKSNNAEEEVSKIIDKESRMKSDDFSAYVLTNDNGNVSSKSIIDEATGMIGQNYLDIVSEMLGYEFNALYKIHAKTFQRQ